MKKSMALLLCAALCFSFLTGCYEQAHRPAPQLPEAAENTALITDMTGRQVCFPAGAKVGAAQGSLAEAWMLAGGTVCAVTEDAITERQLQLPENVADLGGTKAPDLEAAIAAGCEVMLLSGGLSQHLELEEAFTAAGISCVYLTSETFAEYKAMMELFVSVTGRQDLYEKNVLAPEKAIAEACARAQGKPAPTVLLLRAYSTGIKAKGSDNMVGAMLADLGCVNIADSDASLLEDLSIEAIIKADPDCIFITTMGDADAALETVRATLTDEPAWAGLTAVQNGRYHLLEKELFHYKPNARWGESYEKLADILYPGA